MRREGILPYEGKVIMKPFLAFCVAGFAALLLVGCGAEMAGPEAVGQDTSAGVESTGRTTHEPNGKANFVSAAGAFEIWFPEQPKARTTAEEGTKGESYILKKGDWEYFAGFVTHNRNSMTELVLRRAVRSTEERLEGSTTKERTIWFQGNEGREFILREPAESRTLARYYNLGPTLYMTRFTAGDYDFPMDKALEFLDSFNILADPQARIKDGLGTAKILTPAGG
ncbi:hypothetical protein [Desulfocurvibacter africanus]|uniref:Lipoprotein n=1 Tax=Desulfocurvibacter africanus subsp. africanus str. Walvis Bay TaxID=690850 RepID=F3YVD8_DESAF|nr:hypothetical protein [Desulfocurvibacter africanus]EGJ48530.1 hypothetical protein Desaf_0170 [Desulfocurvibacter africanus subsp. africanus str. Walvis Bay]